MTGVHALFFFRPQNFFTVKQEKKTPAPAGSGKGGFMLNIAQPLFSCKKKFPYFHNFVHTAHPTSLK